MLKLVVPMKSSKKYHNHKHSKMQHTAHSSHSYTEEPAMTGLHRVAHDFMDIAEDRPDTWSAYDGQPGGAWDIIQMEFVEAQNAWQRLKASTGTHSDAIKEFKHLGAAVMSAVKRMTCDN